MKKVLSLLVVLAILAVPSLGFAATPSPWTEAETYEGQATGKLEYGLKNILTGWLDLFYEPYVANKNESNVFNGIGKGVLEAVANTVGGVIHAGSFFIPVDIPIPGGGVDLSE